MGCSCTPKYVKTDIPPDIQEKTNRHPCYSFDAHHNYARMHLPVAPKCNISCNYCNRKFDCVNESRPGVTSEILTPLNARDKFNFVREQVQNLSVVGIAGPGDALANWPATRLTLELIKKADPEVVFCLSTNGLMLPEYAQEIIDLGVNHVTVTMNCLDPQIGAKIYKFVIYKRKRYEGVAGAKLLIENQLAGIEYLTKHGVLVKVNTVMIKDINDQHIPEVVKKVGELGAFISNIMPLIPAPGSIFENYPQTSQKDLLKMRIKCGSDLQQMNHCKQCRADAIGLLGQDRSLEFSSAKGCSSDLVPLVEAKKRPFKIALASKHGKLVDQHFGYASVFDIYLWEGDTFKLVEKRTVEQYCSGMEECDTEETKRETMIKALTDCDAVLSMRIGHHAKERLARKGIQSLESCDTVENGLLYAVKVLSQKEIA